MEYLKVLTRQSPGGTEENQENLGSWCFDRDSPECRLGALPLERAWTVLDVNEVQLQRPLRRAQ